MKRISSLLWVWMGLSACGEDRPLPDAHGALALALSSYAGGVEYRLSEGHFSLEGPEPHVFDAGDDPTISLALAVGTYQLTLAPGYRLSRADDASQSEVSARLVSANPATVTITAGQTAHLTLRFELTPNQALSDAGTLAIELAVEVADASAAACSAGLQIDEVDYDQTGTDDAEFVEIVNPGACPASLEGVALELVNGGDGKTYAHYDLSAVASTLAPGARLVVTDPAVISALPTGTPSLALNGSGLQNGPDGLRLLRADTVLDELAYEGAVAGITGAVAPADEGDGALGRCDGTFRLVAPSPGGASVCTP